MAEGIVYIPSHLAAIGLEALQFKTLSVSDFSQQVKLAAKEEIIESNPKNSLHINHLILITKQLYIIFTLSTII
jgi:hypothetical protein